MRAIGSRKHRVRALIVGILLFGQLTIRPQAARAIEPLTIIAAAKAAKEIADIAWDVFEFIDYVPTKPDPMAGVPDKLNEMQEALNRIELLTAETLEAVGRLEEGEVREENEDSLNAYLDAIQHVTAARIALTHLAEDASDGDARLAADVETRLAVTDFETRPQLFRITGPRITDQRFSHVLMYAGYLQALALRVTYIQLAVGPRATTHQPYRAELTASAAKLREMLQSIDAALVVETAVFGPGGHQFLCTYGSARLSDYIAYDRGPISPTSGDYGPNQTVVVVDFPGDSCDANAISFYFEEPIRALRAERTDAYGAPEIAAFAEALENYAGYGQSTAPSYQFANWIMGSLFTTLDGAIAANPIRTIVPVEPAEPGAPVRLAGVEAQQHWQIPLGTGPIVHAASGLCLTHDDAAQRTTLEVCSGAEDQLWRWSNGSIVHPASNACLSSTRSYTLLGGRGGPRPAYYPSLHVAACDARRVDQRWVSSDPTTPGPIIR